MITLNSKYTLLHEWEGSTGEYLVEAGSTGSPYGQVNTEVKDQIFSCAAQPKEYNSIFTHSTSLFG